MPTSILLTVHILVAISVIGLVLIQHGKGADAGAAFGAGAAGGASGSVFGAQGSSNFLSRSTGVLATIFFLTSLSLGYMSQNTDKPKSLMEDSVIQEQASKPAPQQSAGQPTDIPSIPESSVQRPPAPLSANGSTEVPKDMPADVPQSPKLNSK